MEIAFGVIGGLGMFLYGMNIMGTGLQKAAGQKLKRLIEVLTRNRLMAVIVGALVTMVIQSSSGTTVMTVGFLWCERGRELNTRHVQTVLANGAKRRTEDCWLMFVGNSQVPRLL